MSDAQLDVEQLAQRVVDATTHYAASFDRTGRYVAYLGNDHPELCTLYCHDRRAGARVEVLRSADPLHAPGFSEDGSRLYWLADPERSGRLSVFYAPVKTRSSAQLLAAPSERATFSDYRVLPNGSLLLQEEDFDTGATRLVLLRGNERSVLFSCAGYVLLRELDDAALILFGVRCIGAKQYASFELHLSRARVRWTSADATSQRTGAGPDGGRYALTEAGSRREFSLSDASGARRSQYALQLGEVSDWAYAAGSDVVAVVINRGLDDELKLLDARDLRELPRQARLPSGEIRLRGMSRDGRSLLLQVSTVRGPFRTCILDLSRPGMEAVSRLHGNEPVVEAECQVAHVIARDGLQIPTLCYQRAQSRTRCPAIVFLHGGPAAASRQTWDHFWPFYVACGFVVVAPNVRGSTGFGIAYEQADRGERRLEAFRDLERVNAWVRAQPWWDGKNLIAMGASYGGYLTYIALTRQASLWTGGVVLAAPCNLRTLLAHTTGAARLALEHEFGQLERDAAFLESISPLHAANAITSPVYIYQGAQDTVVPRSEAEHMVETLRARAIAVEYQLAAHEGHAIERRDSRLQFLVRSNAFLNEHVLR